MYILLYISNIHIKSSDVYFGHLAVLSVIASIKLTENVGIGKTLRILGEGYMGFGIILQFFQSLRLFFKKKVKKGGGGRIELSCFFFQTDCLPSPFIICSSQLPPPRDPQDGLRSR